MRIIAGKLKGSTIHFPKNKITRPLKDRARESIFNLLIHSNKISFQFEESNILDLYSGTGSFGLECLSRQARRVCFVEKEEIAKKILEKNIEELKVKKSVDIFFGDVFDLIKGMNLSSLVRNEVCTNPNNENEIENILNTNIYSKYSKLFNKTKILDFKSEPNGFGSTTHISILDKKGNAVSITTTNGEGCGYIIPEYGIMMNNMLGEDDLNPFGFHNWSKKRRLPTMLSPIIITEKSKPKFILGSGGSNRIRSANIQVIINLLVNKMKLSDAISSSRIHLEGNTLFYEPGIKIPYEKIKNIILNDFNNQSLFFGGVNAVSAHDAIGDKRRGGYGIVL